MKFFSDIEANHGFWDGKKMLLFDKNGVYETEDKREIELLKKAGYRYEEGEE